MEEYFTRRTLGKLGVTMSLEQMAAFDVECLQIVASEVAKLEQEEARKGRKK